MENEITNFEIVSSPEELQQSMQSEQQAPAPEPTQEVVPPAAPQPEPQPVQEPTPEPTPMPEAQQAPEPIQEIQPTAPQYSEQEVEGAVFSFLSERLGRDITSFDDLAAQQQEAKVLDERIEAIANFVQETGRRPEDWFAYQSLNPSEMDDLTAIRINISSQYPNLSSEEVNMFVQNKYKLDADIYSDEEVRMSQLQLKIDASEAKSKIEDIRSTYRAPEVQEQQSFEAESFIDDEWISKMEREVDTLTGLEFDLGGNKSFTYSLDPAYKSELKEKNARLEQFFDPYVRPDGSWDYDTLSSHRALIDNVDRIIKSAYQQGMSDGQRNVVSQAANVSVETPQTGATSQEQSPLVSGLKNLMGGQRGITFNI